MKILLLTLLLWSFPALAWSESYQIRVSLDHGKTFQPLTLPPSVVRRVLEQMRPGMTAEIQITTRRKVGGFKGKMVEKMTGISCYEVIQTEKGQ